MKNNTISNHLIFISGKTGCGKSTLLSYLILKSYKKKQRDGIVILDFKGEYKNLCQKTDFKYRPIDYETLIENWIDWEGYLKNEPYLIIHPYNFSSEEYAEIADNIAKGVLKIGNMVYIIEEAQLAFPVHTSIRRNMSALITTGRSQGIDVFFVAQRPADVLTTAIAQANIRISFALDDKNDLQRVSTYFKEEEVKKLKRFEFLCLNTMNHISVKSSTNKCSDVDNIIWN